VIELLRFLAVDTFALFNFLLPGLVVLGLVIMGVILYVHSMVLVRKWEPAFVLTFMSLAITILTSCLQLYPYGGIRQCLYLAPVLSLTSAIGLSYVIESFKMSDRKAAAVVIVLVILLSGFEQIRREKPYKDMENSKAVLVQLSQSMEPDDQVYVYYGARPAIEFYRRGQDERFIYGGWHRRHSDEYVPELLGMVRPDTHRLWLVFSHVVPGEEKLIIQDLQTGWEVEGIVSPRGASLYLARRR
jgi:asparagine N-glycosylation enzyme membrane subunit Stt3